MSIPKHVTKNFETLMRAAHGGDLALVEVQDKATGKICYAVTAMGRDDEGNYTMSPFAIMIDGDPFEMFNPPDPDGGFMQPEPTGDNVRMRAKAPAPGARHTVCRFCDLDIEGVSPYRKGEWRDRGNNTTCPSGDNVGKYHSPVREL